MQRGAAAEKMAGGGTAGSGVADNNAMQLLKRENARLEALVSEFRMASPSVARLTDLAVWREREAFEEKKNRALALLRKKDAKIRELGEAVAKRNNITRQRPLDGRTSAAAAAAGGVETCRGNGSRGGGDENNGNTSTTAVVERLEKCIEEQADQIETLLQEVVRLRSTTANNACRSSLAEGDSGGRAAIHPNSHDGRGFTNDTDAGVEDPRTARGAQQRVKLPKGVVTEDLRSQAAQLEPALATQSTELPQMDAAMKQASTEHREREARLRERVETLERLQEAARRTVLDREERLERAEAAVANAEQCGAGHEATTTGVASAAADAGASRGAEPAVSGGGGGGRYHAAAAEEYIDAQEWWLHLAAAEKRRDERERKSREAAVKTSAASRSGGVAGSQEGGEGGGKEARRLHRVLEEQGLEIVALRQRVLKAEFVARAKGRDEPNEDRRAAEEIERLGGAEDLAAAAASAEGSAAKTQKFVDSLNLAEMEGRVAALHAQGDTREALVVARETISALKMALIRAEGEVELQAQLLKDEKRRSVAALSKAADLQGKMDRIAVGETLRGVSGGVVSASALIDRFAGTLYRQSRRVKDMEAEVRNMRARCARLARLARGDSADACPTVDGASEVAGGEEHPARSGNRRPEIRWVEDECWVEPGVQEAAAAMEAGRRRALEQEIESLRNEVLAERRRADAAERDAKDERRLRSLAAPAKQDENINNGVEAALRRKLKLAASEVEALRTHTRDLRDQIQSGWWSWTAGSSEAATDTNGSETLSGDGEEPGFFEGHSSGAFAAAESALREMEAAGTDGGGGDDNSASIEVDRLTSLLAERNAQVSVLTSAVEALQTSPAFVSSPTKVGMAAPTSGNSNQADASSPPVRASRENTRSSPGKVFSGSCWADVSDGVEADGGGVDVLNHVGAQGLARRCVALTVRLTTALAREGKAERRADRLAAEMERRDRKIRAAAIAEEGLTRRNLVLENTAKKTAAALNGLRAESAARLREAGEEASKLRNALRDAELGADDACQRLASARAEIHALVVELRATREQHRDEVRRLTETHDARIKDCADRLFLHTDDRYRPQPFLDGLGTRGRKRGVTMAVAAAAASSPVGAAIAELAAQWRAFVSKETENDESNGSDKNRRRRHRTSTSADVAGPSGGYRFGYNMAAASGSSGIDRRAQEIVLSERQLAATATFLQEAAARLDTECSRAVRRARALEWELAGARRGQLDATTALEEAREEVCRLSARTAVAEDAVAAALPAASELCPGPTAAPSADFLATSCSSVTLGGNGNGYADGDERGTGRSFYTVAAVSLLEKRHAAAMEDLIALEAARAAAVAGETAAKRRAEAAETRVREAVASADLLAAELERHKSLVSDGVAAKAAEWRREIRAELGRWWQDDLLALHNGVILDWGSAGAADDIAAAWTSSRYNPGAGGGSRHVTADVDGVNRGVSGEEAMAQALIAGRAEQAYLEDRLKINEHRLGQMRTESLRLRAILERWHRDFVAPALQKAKKRQKPPPPGGPGGTSEATRRGPVAVAETTVLAMDGKAVLERKLQEATAGLLGVREEAAGLRREVAALRALVARLREDENDTRETAGRRVETAREIARRRADGDLKDAEERLQEERERFKSQLGAAHTEILWLGAKAAELERLRNLQEQRCNSQEFAEQVRANAHFCVVGGNGLLKGGVAIGDGGIGLRTGGGEGGLDERMSAPAGARKRPANCDAREGEDTRAEWERERALRREVEEERDTLRRMCNGLAVDLKEAAEARSEAEDEREALVQEAARAKAEAKMAGLARENLEAAIKELGRLLEFARGTPVEGIDGDRSLRAATLSGWDCSKDAARRFARIMVAAKVAEADLLRRLEGASSSEANLRHLLQLRDVRIEELKRQQATPDRLGRSVGGGGGSGSQPHYQRLNLRESGSAAVAPPASAGGSKTKAVASERVGKEVALRASIQHLELELAEASARGEVGDAATRAAERIALRLFPEARSSGDGVGVEGNGCYHPHGKTRERLRRSADNLTESESHGRGSLFLMPSADVERKAALAPSVASAPALDIAGEGRHASSPAAVGKSTPTAKNIGLAEARVTTPARSSIHPRLANSPARTAGKGKRGSGPSSPFVEASLGFSNGVRSLEAHLARLEAVVACSCRGGVVESIDGGPEGFGPAQSGSSPRERRTVEAAWAEAVRELRVQAVDLRHRAEATEELLEEERAGKDCLEEEVLRLRTELLRQQRSYWQATAVLKDRYAQAKRGHDGDKPASLGVAVAVGSHEAAVSSGTATGGRGQQQRHYEPSLEVVKEAIRAREQELRDVRDLHAREAKEVAAELARVIEAHRTRLSVLEEKLTRARRKMRVMARPKPTTTTRKERVSLVGLGDGGDGDGDVGSYPGALCSSTPLSADELLNLLAAADEELFEAKARTQRLEYELRTKNVEAEALFLLRKEEGVTAVADPVPTERVGVQGESGGGSAGDGDAQARVAVISFHSAVAAAKIAADVAGTFTLANVARAARLASAEAEVETLRENVFAAREVAIGAQREVSALQLAAHKRTVDRADESRSREKELRRQVSAYKREVERLRSTASAAGALAPTAEKTGRAMRRRGVGAAATGEETEASKLRRRAQQLAVVREESERRGRTIAALREAKAALSEDLQRLQKRVMDQEDKLGRALKDVGVKNNAVKALREKITSLEAEIDAHKAAKTNASVAPASHVISAANNGSSVTDAGGSATGSGKAAGIVVEPPAPRCDAQTATARDLRSERDRLRGSMRGWHGLLSKKTAEISAQVAALERLEEEAKSLRVAVARKDDAYRTTKKQLVLVREEYEQFKSSSHRWRADAETKWRGLKQASEAAVRRAKNSEKSGDAAELELAALKSAFRSFLKTLWDDLRSRPPLPTSAPPAAAGVGGACPVPVAISGYAGREYTCSASASPRRLASGSGSGGASLGDGKSDVYVKGATNWIQETAPASTGVFRMNTMTNDQGGAGEELFAGLSKATAAMAAVVVGGVENSPKVERGGGNSFAELTEAEVSDIMQALSAGKGGADAYLLSSSSSSSSSSPPPSHHPHVAVTAPTLVEASASPSKSQQQQQQQQQQIDAGGRGGAVERATTMTSPCTLLERGFGNGKEPLVERSSTEFEGKEAFSDRVESALGGSNTSSALAELLRSLRASGFSKPEADGALDDGAVCPSTPLAVPKETKMSISWSQPYHTAFTRAVWPRAAGGESGYALERWTPLLDKTAPTLAGSVVLGGGGGGGGGMLSPLEERPSASSLSDTAVSGGSVGDNFERLLVGDLASPS